MHSDNGDALADIAAGELSPTLGLAHPNSSRSFISAPHVEESHGTLGAWNIIATGLKTNYIRDLCVPYCSGCVGMRVDQYIPMGGFYGRGLLDVLGVWRVGLED